MSVDRMCAAEWKATRFVEGEDKKQIPSAYSRRGRDTKWEWQCDEVWLDVKGRWNAWAIPAPITFATEKEAFEAVERLVQSRTHLSPMLIEPEVAEKLTTGQYPNLYDEVHDATFDGLIAHFAKQDPSDNGGPVAGMLRDLQRARREVRRLRKIIDTPETNDFVVAVVREKEHQRNRWGADHDEQKTHADWFWLLGYLGGKALYAALGGDVEKAKHHTITAAAMLSQWHEAICKSEPTA